MTTANNQLSAPEKIVRYFTQLGFFTAREAELGGNREKKTAWTLFVYLLASLGIFSRQITNFPHVSINFTNLKWSVLLASFIFGLVALPYIVKKINEHTKDVGIQQILSAFATGFFIDFTTNAVMNYYFK